MVDLLDSPDWKCPRDYAPCLTLSRSAWAWEFLRRNEAFQKERCQCGVKNLRKDREITSYEISEDSLLKSWGLFFCKHPERVRQCFLAAVPFSQCHALIRI